MEIANIPDIILMNHDDDDTDCKISNDTIDSPGQSTLSSNIEEHYLDIRHEILHLDQTRCDEKKGTTRVPLRKKRSCADSVMVCTSLPNL
jgi:hypothetical protein